MWMIRCTFTPALPKLQCLGDVLYCHDGLALHVRIQKILSVGVQFLRFFYYFIYFFTLMRVEDPNTTIRGPSLARQRNVIEMAFRWRADDVRWLGSFVVFQRIWTRIAKKPYIFVIFQEWSGPMVPHLDRHMHYYLFVLRTHYI